MPILYKVGGRSWGGTNGFQPIMQGTGDPSPTEKGFCRKFAEQNNPEFQIPNLFEKLFMRSRRKEKLP